MKGLALAAVGAAAVIGLAACSQGKAPIAAPTGHGSGTAKVPVSCNQQYRAWEQSNGKGLMGALNAVTSAASAGDAQVLTAALKQATPAVARATEHPIPACADPRGYWSALLMHVNAAASSKGSASSVRAAMQDVPKIHHNLMTEVRQTAQ
jgi:hypothetical protein